MREDVFEVVLPKADPFEATPYGNPFEPFLAKADPFEPVPRRNLFETLDEAYSVAASRAAAERTRQEAEAAARVEELRKDLEQMARP